MNGEQLAVLEGRRAASTRHGHLLVDDGLAAELEALGATGLSTRGVYARMPDNRLVKLRWRQICAARTLPPVSPRTTGLTRDERQEACTVCRRACYLATHEVPVRLVYRASDLAGAEEVCWTWEREGFEIRKPEPLDYRLCYPWMLVSPRVWRVFRDAGVTSFDWLPIRVEEACEEVEEEPASEHGPPSCYGAPCTRTEVGILFGVKQLATAQAVLGSAGCGPDVATVEDMQVLRRLGAQHVDVSVTLEDTDPRLPVLLDLLKQHGETWLEQRRDRFTAERLASARLLIMEAKGEHEVFGGPRVGTTYDLEGACRVCGAGARQTSEMMIDGDDLPKLDGLVATATFYSDILVHERLARDLEAVGATGVSFRKVYAVMRNKRRFELAWRQLCAAHTLPRMSPRSTGIDRMDECTSCGRSGFSAKMAAPSRLVYRARDLDGAQDVNTTWEWFGEWRFDGDVSNALFSYPWFLVTPKIMRVFRDAGVTSFDWLPVRVEEDSR